MGSPAQPLKSLNSGFSLFFDEVWGRVTGALLNPKKTHSHCFLGDWELMGPGSNHQNLRKHYDFCG